MRVVGERDKFYNALKNIFSNSCEFIKLSGYLSKKFGVSKGTEQGHPLSPDLFKIYLSDLSCLLELKECALNELPTYYGQMT